LSRFPISISVRDFSDLTSSRLSSKKIGLVKGGVEKEDSKSKVLAGDKTKSIEIIRMLNN
jgi:hypothetical protein